MCRHLELVPRNFLLFPGISVKLHKNCMKLLENSKEFRHNLDLILFRSLCSIGEFCTTWHFSWFLSLLYLTSFLVSLLIVIFINSYFFCIRCDYRHIRRFAYGEKRKGGHSQGILIINWEAILKVFLIIN